MSDIQRWDVDMHGSMFESDDGPLVFHVDHVAAVAAAQREGANQGYLNGVATNADNSFKAGVKAAREQIVAYLRDETQHPSIEAGAWAYGFAEVIEQGAFNGANALEKP